MATVWKYLPILKGKGAEYAALQEAYPHHWADMVPLIEVLSEPVGDDEPAFKQRILIIGAGLAASIPEGKEVAICTRFLDDKYRDQAHLLDMACRLIAKASGRTVIPVVTQVLTHADLQRLHAGFEEVILRIATPTTESMQVAGYVKNLTDSGFTKKQIHLLIDQESIVKRDIAPTAAAVKPFLTAAIAAGCRSVTLAGGSFPLTLAGYKQGIHPIPRVDWQVWSRIKKEADFANVRYSDYTVTNPDMPEAVDPAVIKPAIAIRYASTTDWFLFKGGPYRKGTPGDYTGLCQLLMAHASYSGAKFSHGDAEYAKKAGSTGKVAASNGQPQKWRQDATSHHLAFVTGSKL